MIMPLTYNGRLPGVMCETNRPKPPSDPLQLDITGFVGFAERGPLNLPVAVEDISQYRRIFGGDLAVATDGGRPVYAHLPNAVQSFFDNGGRTAYVVRVADDSLARANRFLMPGLVTWQDAQIQPIVLPAAWVGHWSDNMSVGTQLRSDPLRIRNIAEPFTQNSDELEINLLLPAFDIMSAGDLLRLHFKNGDTHTHLLLRASDVQADNGLFATMNDIPVTVSGHADSTLCLQFQTPDDLTAPDEITLLTADGWQSVAFFGVDALDPYTIAVPAEANMQAGQLLRVQYGAGDSAQMLYFPIDEIDHARAEDNTVYQQVISDGAFRMVDLSTISGQQPIQVDLLRFDVTIREGQRTLERWSEQHFGGERDNWQDILTSIPPERFSMSQDDFSGSLRLGQPENLQHNQAIPFGMLTLSAFAEALPDTETTSKDGLDTFALETLFLDDTAKNFGWRALPAQANQRLYLSNPPQKFSKLHSLWAVPEVAIIALPDAVHRAWEYPEEIIDEEPEPEPEAPEEDERDWSKFEQCMLDEPEPLPDDDRTLPDWLHIGSFEDAIGVPLAQLPHLKPQALYEVDPLLTVQRSLINFCAARADVVGILSLPRHFKVRETTDWQQKLINTPAFFDGQALSYVAAYHGWLRLRESNTPELSPLRDVPPDGVITGMIASRELNRGAWIAPANVALLGVVATVPEFVDEDWKSLYNRQINVIRQQPGRFTMMSAYTLSRERLLLQLSIRRLLIFLRKICLQQGQRYVFETNNTRFRERVKSQFERLMSELVNQGALVAYQIETGRTVNTQNDYDNGRFIIAIKIAPTNPIELITITLLRSGETLLQVQER